MLYLLLAAASSAALTLVLKWFRDPQGNPYGLLLGNYLTCALIAFIQMPDRAHFFDISASTLLLGCIGGVLFVAGLVLMQRSIRESGATLTSAFSKLGMLVPLFVSLLFFGESPGWLQAAGILLAIAAILVLNRNGAAQPGKTGGRPALFLLLLTLLVCGSSEGMMKVFEQLGNPAEDTRYFFILFLTAALLTAFLAIIEKRKSGKALRPAELFMGILAGIPNYFSSYFLLKALLFLPAMLVYPAFSVGTILLVMGISALFFRERLDKRQGAGLLLILAALVLLNL